MFTGIVQHVGSIVTARSSAVGLRLGVDARGWAHGPLPGDSIAVNGCCLTLAAERSSAEDPLQFDVVPQTLALTTLGSWAPGTRVNLEHAATPTTLMGGHLVQGHVDGVGHVLRNGADASGDWRLVVEVPAALMDAMVAQGSICLDGVSLTIAALDGVDNVVEVALIPTTLEKTTLGGLRSGDRVNVEADIIAKQVAAIAAKLIRPPTR